MKAAYVLGFLLCLAVATLSETSRNYNDKDDDEFFGWDTEDIEECLEEAGLTFESFKTARDAKEYEKLACLIQCLLQDEGIIKEDGSIDEAEILEYVKEEQEMCKKYKECDEVQESIDFQECAVRAGSVPKDKCQPSLYLYNCMQEKGY